MSRFTPLQRAEREKLDKLLKRLKEGSRKEVKFNSNDNFSSLLGSAARIISKELTNLITIGFQITEATREIQKQHITPSLFVREDLDKLIQEVEKTEPFYNFSIGIKLGSLRYLDKLCAIKYGAWMSKFVIELETPLLSKEKSILYKMLPIAVPQVVFERQKIAAFIKPNSKYLLVKGREHYNFDEDELLKCERIENSYVCPTEWFLFSNHSNCESSLIFEPKKINFEKCNIQIINSFQPQFMRAHTGDSWIYIVDGPVEIE